MLSQYKELCPALFSEEQSPKLSERYQFVNSESIIKELYALGWRVAQVQQQGNSPYAAHMVRLEAMNGMYRLPDNSHINLILINSHDGSVRFQLRIGVYRMVCSNGLVVGSDVVNPIAIKHLVCNRRALQAAIDKAAVNFSHIYQRISAMMDRQIEDGELVDLLVAGINARWGKEALPKGCQAGALAFGRRREDMKNSVWHVFNRIQENLIHGQPGNKVRRLKSPVKCLKVNNELWNAAEKLVA